MKRRSISAGSGQQDAETNDQVSFPSAGRRNTRPSLICSRASPMCTTTWHARAGNSQGSSGAAPLPGAEAPKKRDRWRPLKKNWAAFKKAGQRPTCTFRDKAPLVSTLYYGALLLYFS